MSDPRLFPSEHVQPDALFAPPRAASSPYQHLAWMIAVTVLAAAMVTGYYWDRSRAVVEKIMSETGNALLIAMEGGLRSGARSPGGIRLQYLLEELVGRISVQFIALTTHDGLILAHSNPSRVGSYLSDSTGRWIVPRSMGDLAPSPDSQWAVMDMEGDHAFVVYRLLDTAGDKRRGLAPHTVCVFLGMSTRPLRNAAIHDQRQSLVYGGGVLAIGLTLTMCAYAVQRMRASRRRQREAEALMDELALTLPDGLILFDVRGRLMGMNAAAMSLLHLSEIQLNRRNSEKILERLPRPLLERITALQQAKTLEDSEIALEHDAKTVHLSVRGGQVGAGRDGCMGFLLLLRDVSEVRRLEAEVRRREKLAAVGNLAAGVAHELRNPLSSIKGYATYFSERFPEGSDERAAARVMVRETERLNRTISELIGLARPTDIKTRPTDTKELLDDVLRLIRQDAAARDVRVRLIAGENLPPVPLDPDRIRQVLLNVCINALDAMPGGGELTVSAALSGEQPGHMLLEIKDTGRGIAPEDLPHIFDPYFTTKGHGTGLGLATVHKIMEAHGGRVLVTSAPGEGTSFKLLFPLAPDADHQ